MVVVSPNEQETKGGTRRCRAIPWSKGSECNEPFGSRPEPGAQGPGLIHQPSPGEVPEGPADAHPQSICPRARAHSKAGAGTGRSHTIRTHLCP